MPQGRFQRMKLEVNSWTIIFDTLTHEDNAPLELSFLFASKQARQTSMMALNFWMVSSVQTTLFLLYWYMFN